MMEDICLTSASYSEIDQKVFNCQRYSRETVRRTTATLNSLLKFIGREFTIQKPQKINNKISHISEKKLNIMLKNLPKEMDKIVSTIIFYTGLRTGELWALEDDDISFKDNTISISKQLTQKGLVEPPKCNKNRIVVFPRSIKTTLKAWLSITSQKKSSERDKVTRRVSKVSAKLWGKGAASHVSLHDLRKSFAIHMLQNNFSLTEIALLLGDSMAVVQKYYAGYALQESQAVQLAKRLA
jgi:integrase